MAVIVVVVASVLVLGLALAFWFISSFEYDQDHREISALTLLRDVEISALTLVYFFTYTTLAAILGGGVVLTR